MWLWCTDIWCIHTFTLHMYCTILLSVQLKWFLCIFLLWSPLSHCTPYSSHLVVRINYFWAVSSSTIHLLLNWLSITLSFNSIWSLFAIFHTSIVVWLLRKFKCRICIVTYLIPIYFPSHPVQYLSIFAPVQVFILFWIEKHCSYNFCCMNGKFT